MEIIDKTDQEARERRQNLDLVNRLVRETFGKRFRADYSEQFDLGNPCVIGIDLRHDRLGLIGKKGGFGGYVIAGQAGGFFTPNADGSTIAVVPDFKVQALKYAAAYKHATGRDVTVLITDNFNTYDPRGLSPDTSE